MINWLWLIPTAMGSLLMGMLFTGLTCMAKNKKEWCSTCLYNSERISSCKTKDTLQKTGHFIDTRI